MKKIIKIFSIIMALSFIFTTVACSKKGGDTSFKLEEGVSYDSRAGISEQVIGNIVKDGTSDYKIVVSIDAEPAELTAATELSSFVNKLTGVTLPIITESKTIISSYTENSKYISIGNTELLNERKFSIDYNQLNGCGFIIKTHGQSVYFNGASARGTLYSVYDFLEKICGVKFVSFDYTYLPEKVKDIPLNSLDIYEIPYFEYRSYMAKNVHMNNYAFMARMRMTNEYATIPEEWGGGIPLNSNYGTGIDVTHNSIGYVPVEKYGSDPKYKNLYSTVLHNGQYSEINWANGIAEDGSIDESMEVSTIKVALETLKTFVINNPSKKYFGITAGDGAAAPQNDDYVAAAKKYTNAGVMLRFVNCLAREIQKWADEELDGREIYLVTLSYGMLSEPPVVKDGNGGYKLIDGVTDIPDNLLIRIATMSSMHYLPIVDSRQREAGSTELYKKWSSICDKFMIWDYDKQFFHYFWYYPVMQRWQQDFTLFKQIGAKYVMINSSYNSLYDWQAIMRTYVASKMMWNPNRDINALQNEFIHYYFGEYAEQYIKNFKSAFDAHYVYLAETANYNTEDKYPVMHYQNKYITSADSWSCQFLLERYNELLSAIESVKNAEDLTDKEKEAYITRIECVALTPLYMLDYNRLNYNIQESVSSEISYELNRIIEKLGDARKSEW